MTKHNDYETRRAKVVVHALGQLQNGHDREHVEAAAAAVYYDGIEDLEWLAKTLTRLGWSQPTLEAKLHERQRRRHERH